MELLHDSCDGQNWNSKNAWFDRTVSIASWEGVEIDVDRHVVSIELPNNGLAGQGPRCYYEMVVCHQGYFSCVEPSGCIPTGDLPEGAFIDSMDSLARFDVTDNNLIGIQVVQCIFAFAKCFFTKHVFFL